MDMTTHQAEELLAAARGLLWKLNSNFADGCEAGCKTWPATIDRRDAACRELQGVVDKIDGFAELVAAAESE